MGKKKRVVIRDASFLNQERKEIPRRTGTFAERKRSKRFDGRVRRTFAWERGRVKKCQTKHALTGLGGVTPLTC